METKVEPGIRFTYPYEHIPREWVVLNLIKKGWRCKTKIGKREIVSIFSRRHLNRIYHCQQIIKDMPVGYVGSNAKDNVNRRRTRKDS